MAALDVVLETMEVEKTKEVREMEASDLLNSIGGSLGNLGAEFLSVECCPFEVSAWGFPSTASSKFSICSSTSSSALPQTFHPDEAQIPPPILRFCWIFLSIRIELICRMSGSYQDRG